MTFYRSPAYRLAKHTQKRVRNSSNQLTLSKPKPRLTEEQLFDMKMKLALDELDRAYNAKAIEQTGPMLVKRLIKKIGSNPDMLQKAVQTLHHHGYENYARQALAALNA